MVENEELEGGQETGTDIEINEWENRPQSNSLPKGRYPFETITGEYHYAPSGNKCLHLIQKIEGITMHDYPIIADKDGKKHKMSFKFFNYLFAIGIRNTNKKFTINTNTFKGAKGLCDVGIKENGDNQIDNYSPIKEETAPMTDVPPENIPETEPEKPKEKTKTKPDPKKETEKVKEKKEDVSDL